MEEPTKSDIDTIFKRLKTHAANKMCFDCSAKNPTWASVTYGVFVCIDCSARHRNLGVHLSFIRSTNLDTNWNWLQLRAMQVGGNANAEAFFQQHGCQTKDVQQKYNSRAAQLYREKVQQLASKATKQYGNQLIIDDGPKNDQTFSGNEKKENDFFRQHSQPDVKPSWDVASGASNQINQNSEKNEQTTEGPSVDANLLSEDAPNKTLDPKKTTIGQRRPPATKKKGFGAQKVQADFKEIERTVEEQEKLREQQLLFEVKNREAEAKRLETQMAGLKFAYQDIDKQRKLEEEKLKQSNPKKAEQIDRLGMGLGNRSGISHSAMTDMHVIQQEGLNSSRPVPNMNQNQGIFDNYDILDSTSRHNTLWEAFDEKPNTREFGQHNGNQSSFSKSNKSYGNSDSYNTRSNTSSSTSFNNSNDKDGLKRFSNAKSISSDQFFNRDSDVRM